LPEVKLRQQQCLGHYTGFTVYGVREKLLKERKLLVFPDPMTIFRLPYLALCNETLRIHPVAMLTFPRVVKEPVELLGQQLEPGKALVGCIYLTHQREVYTQSKQFNQSVF